MDIWLVDRSQLASVHGAEEPGAKDQEPNQPESSQPRAVAVPHQSIEDVSSYPPRQVALGEAAALLSDEDASGVLVMPGAAVDGGELVVDLRRVAARVPTEPLEPLFRWDTFDAVVYKPVEPKLLRPRRTIVVVAAYLSGGQVEDALQHGRFHAQCTAHGSYLEIQRQTIRVGELAPRAVELATDMSTEQAHLAAG